MRVCFIVYCWKMILFYDSVLIRIKALIDPEDADHVTTNPSVP